MSEHEDVAVEGNERDLILTAMAAIALLDDQAEGLYQRAKTLTSAAATLKAEVSALVHRATGRSEKPVGVSIGDGQVSVRFRCDLKRYVSPEANNGAGRGV